MEIVDMEKVERKLGVASTVKAEDFAQQYSEGVERFLRDNQSAMGDKWVRKVGEKLYNLQGKNKEGDVLGSSTDIGVAIATFTDIPLITGQQLLGLYKQAGNKNPFGSVYIDFGVHVNGTPRVNPIQAKLLLADFANRGIKIENGRVPDLAQLRLIADQEAGLDYKLADNVKDVASISAYPFREGYVGKDGLFRAYLDRDGYWFAFDVDLAYSSDYGRVVRYDAEGVVAPKKSNEDLAGTLTKEFKAKF
jgi:hypothetical protein